MPWETPITDWDGITEVPNRKWYNFQDLNRVESNTEALADLIESYSLRPSLAALVTNRDMTRIEFFDGLNRIENNILALKESSYQPLEWIVPKTDWVSVEDPFSYVDANRLETNLQALYTLINNIKGYLQYCGTFSCGEDNTFL